MVADGAAVVLYLAMRILVVAVMLSSGTAYAQHWTDATADCLGNTGNATGWTNKVEVADVDGDGQVDILLANGGDYSQPGSAEASRVWRNTGNWGVTGSHCTEITSEALGGIDALSRVIKAADIDADGDLDIVFGGAWNTQLKLFKRGNGTWTDASAQLPQQPTSIGDLEFGDVDRDGDLDMVLAEWGSSLGAGGRTRLYLNNGSGTFTEATVSNMPDVLIEWSWELEFVDVDNDWDLDILVSCKLCTSSRLFRNDGTGHFTDVPDALPAHDNNYEFEAMDIDNDGDLDLATINDGGPDGCVQLSNCKDTLLVNDGTGKFTDASAQLGSNPRQDDNAALFLDVDSDGDPDLFIGSLGTDRLLLNDGAGNFTLAANATPNDTPSTLGVALADLDGDGRLDLVQGQGESAFPDKIQLASSMVIVDDKPPIVRFELIDGKVVARIHDRHSPARAHDYKRVFAETAGGDVDLAWYGEYLYTAAATGVTRVCAVDQQDNMGCADMPSSGDGAPGGDAGLPPIDQSSGCCDANKSPAASLLPFGLAILVLRRRRRSAVDR